MEIEQVLGLPTDDCIFVSAKTGEGIKELLDAICARLRYLERGMPIYRALRTKWVVMNTWFTLLENHYSYVTPELPIKLKRRRTLQRAFFRSKVAWA